MPTVCFSSIHTNQPTEVIDADVLSNKDGSIFPGYNQEMLFSPFDNCFYYVIKVEPAGFSDYEYATAGLVVKDKKSISHPELNI